MTTNNGLKFIDVLLNKPQDWNTIPIRILKAQLRRVNNIDEIEIIILERNKQHLNQVEGTPFTKEPLRSIIGKDACNEASGKFLTGSFNCETILLHKPFLEDLRNHKGELKSKIESI